MPQTSAKAPQLQILRAYAPLDLCRGPQHTSTCMHARLQTYIYGQHVQHSPARQHMGLSRISCSCQWALSLKPLQCAFHRWWNAHCSGLRLRARWQLQRWETLATVTSLSLSNLLLASHTHSPVLKERGTPCVFVL